MSPTRVSSFIYCVLSCTCCFSSQVTKIVTAIILCLSISPPVYRPTPCISPPNHWSEHVYAQGLLTEFYGTPALWNFHWGSSHTCRAAQEIKFNDKVNSELRGEVSKTFIIVRLGLGPSNQLNSTPGLTLCHVATKACTAEKTTSNQQLDSSNGRNLAL